MLSIVWKKYYHKNVSMKDSYRLKRVDGKNYQLQFFNRKMLSTTILLWKKTVDKICSMGKCYR